MATTDDDVIAFRTGLLADIQESRGGNAVALPDFSENIFTEKCTEFLSEAALTENPEICHFERSFGNRTARANGYAVSDDEATVDIFTVCFDGGEQLTSLAPDDARLAREE